MEVYEIERVSAEELAEIMANNPGVPVFDVRKKSEYQSEHIVDVENAPLDFINESMLQMPKDKPAYVHCAGGYRSMIFAVSCAPAGYDNLIDVAGGLKAIKDSEKFQVSDYVCPSTLL